MGDCAKVLAAAPARLRAALVARISDAELAAWRMFSAASRFSPAAWAGPELHTRYCCRHDGDGGADVAKPPPDPAGAAEPPPDPQAISVSPAASAALAKMTLRLIGGFPPKGARNERHTRGCGDRCTANSARRRSPASH